MKLGRKNRDEYLAKNINKEFREQVTLGQRVADKVASFGGSWPFIFIFIFVLSVWMFYQIIVAHNKGFDPYPFILLNLVLSSLAAIQAPIIMMSQNRYAQKDRLRADHDYEINLKAEKEIEHVQKELDLIKENQNQRMIIEIEEIKALLTQVNNQIQSSS